MGGVTEPQKPREFHPLFWAACLMAGEHSQASPFGFLFPCGEGTWGRAQEQLAPGSLDAGHVLSQSRGLWVLPGPAFAGQAWDLPG